MKKKAKKIIRKPFEVVEEFTKEAKKQIRGKEPASEEIFDLDTSIDPKQIKNIGREEEEKLGKVRMEKARMIPEWRHKYEKIQSDQLKAVKEREGKEVEQKRVEEHQEKEKEEKKEEEGGAEAIAATGSSQKRPTGLWGVGKKFKKKFRWTAERKGKSPK